MQIVDLLPCTAKGSDKGGENGLVGWFAQGDNRSLRGRSMTVELFLSSEHPRATPQLLRRAITEGVEVVREEIDFFAGGLVAEACDLQLWCVIDKKGRTKDLASFCFELEARQRIIGSQFER